MFKSATDVPKSSWSLLSTPWYTDGANHPNTFATDATCSAFIPEDENIGHWIQIDIKSFRAVRGVLLEHRKGGSVAYRAGGTEVRIGFIELTDPGLRVSIPYFSRQSKEGCAFLCLIERRELSVNLD